MKVIFPPNAEPKHILFKDVVRKRGVFRALGVSANRFIMRGGLPPILIWADAPSDIIVLTPTVEKAWANYEMEALDENIVFQPAQAAESGK